MNIHLTGRMRLPLTALSAFIVTAAMLAAVATAAAPARAVTVSHHVNKLTQVSHSGVPVPGMQADPFTVVNYHSHLCLGIQGGGNDQIAVQWGCKSHADQIWHWGSQNSSYPGWYQLVNANGSCLGVAGGSLGEGAHIVGWTCLGSSHLDQYWFVLNVQCGGVYFPFENLNSGYVMGVSGNSTAWGAAVVQWAYQGQCNNQFWQQQGLLHTVTRTLDSRDYATSSSQARRMTLISGLRSREPVDEPSQVLKRA